MAKVIVSTVNEMRPEGGGGEVSIFRAGGPVLEVSFADGSGALVDMSTERGAVYAELIDDMRRAMLPVYVEVDERSRVISTVLLPLVVRAIALEHLDNGSVEVMLEISQAVHTLRPQNPRFEELLAILKKARRDASMLLVTDSDDHEIIDVRVAPFPDSPVIAALDRSPAALAIPVLKAIPESEANRLFNLVSGKTCDPRTTPAPCIPFLYPDDGCWGRAHEMARLMITDGTSPNKIWLYGSLRVKTRNNPTCEVRWGWHVAPTVLVSVNSAQHTYVLDPSMFTQPVKDDVWAGAQTNGGTKAHTSSAVFYRDSQGRESFDGNYANTAQVLTRFRGELKRRSIQVGPPPYNCPP